jgi:peroxiredoxin
MRLGVVGIAVLAVAGLVTHFRGQASFARRTPAVASIGAAALPPSPREIPVGARLPALTLLDDSGQPVTLSSVRGKPTVLLFFRATSCPICRSQLTAFAQTAARFEAAGIQVVATSPDSPAALAEMRRELGLRMRLLSDAGEQAVSALCGGLAHCQILADSAGVIRWGAFSESWCHPPPPEVLLAALRDAPVASAEH